MAFARLNCARFSAVGIDIGGSENASENVRARGCLGGTPMVEWRLREPLLWEDALLLLPDPFTSHRTSFAQSSEVYCCVAAFALASFLRGRRTLSLLLELLLSKLVGRPLSGVVARVDGGPEDETQLLFETLGVYDPATVDADEEGTADNVDDVDAAEGGLAGDG